MSEAGMLGFSRQEAANILFNQSIRRTYDPTPDDTGWTFEDLTAARNTLSQEYNNTLNQLVQKADTATNANDSATLDVLYSQLSVVSGFTIPFIFDDAKDGNTNMVTEDSLQNAPATLFTQD